jgi:hypothetical protein
LRYWLMLAEGHLTRTWFAAMSRNIALLPLPANGSAEGVYQNLSKQKRETGWTMIAATCTAFLIQRLALRVRAAFLALQSTSRAVQLHGFQVEKGDSS